MAYILAFDQGTTSSRAIVFDDESRNVGIGQKELTQIYPHAGWVEQDPVEIWETQIQTAAEALQRSGLSASDIEAVGLTNQRETTIVWDRRTGEPVYNAIVWQDRRTSAFCDEARELHGSMIRDRTGLEVDAYFSASKINWILENVPGSREKAEIGDLLFGTVDSWLVWKLTSGRCHVTDPSNASRTLLFNINSLEWDPELLDIFQVPSEMLPSIVDSSGVFAEVSDPLELSGIPIAGVVGDQQAALFGQVCTEAGESKNTYGTGCFMLQNTGRSPAPASGGLLSTIAWRIDGETFYALEGSVFIGGAVVQWLRDSLGMIENSSDIEPLAASCTDSGGVIFVPAFAGLGTPYWNQNARGLMIGLTRGTRSAHIARAALESIAFQSADLLDAIRASAYSQLPELRVDGGAARNEMLLQFQADILQLPVVRPEITETTALGAAYLAGLAVGVWRSRSELRDHWRLDKKFIPQIDETVAREMRERWHDAVRRSMNWAK